jgi:hypothetical protein
VYQALLIALIGVGIYGGWKYRAIFIPYFRSAHPILFFYIFLFYVVTISIAIIAWVLIIKQFTHGISIFEHVKIYCLTLISRRLPGTVWYIGGRAILYKDLGVSPVIVSFASTVEIIAILLSGSIVGIFMFIAGLQLKTSILILLILLLLALSVILHPYILTKLLKLVHQTPSEKILWYYPILWVLTFSLVWISGGLMVLFITKIFYQATLSDTMRIIGFWSLSGVFGYLTFLLPSSFGVTDISLAVFLSGLMPLPIAAAIALLTRLLTTIFEFLLSIVFVVIGRINKKISWLPLE